MGFQNVDHLVCNTSASQLRWLLMRLSHKTTKNEYRQKPKLHKQFYDISVQGAIILGCYLQEL